MEYEPISRELSLDDVVAMCRRTYRNNVFRVDIGTGRPVVLRVAPELMRNKRDR